MGRALLTLVLAFAGLGLTAQEVLTTDYFPEAGDTLRTNLADSMWATTLDFKFEGGADLAWDFRDPVTLLALSSPVSPVGADSPFPDADFIIEDNIFNTRYLRREGDDLILIGLDTRFEIFPEVAVSTPVEPGRPERRTGLMLGDVFVSNNDNINTVAPDTLPDEALALLPPDIINSVDSVRITATAVRTDEVDAYGVVRLGDNFYQCVREKRTESIEIKVEALVGFLGYIDITEQLALDNNFADLVGEQLPTVTYYWWNNDSKEPIVQLTTTPGDTVVAMSFKRALEPTSTRGPGLTQAEVNIYPNPATDFTTFEVEGLSTGQYVLSLTNMIGQRTYRRSFSAIGNQTQLLLDVSGYPSGQYIATLRNERGHSLMSRRLIVR